MRDHILSVAERLFYSEGTKVVGVDRIISEADIAKATLYRHFSTKEELIEAYLRARHERILIVMRGELLSGVGDPAKRLLSAFTLLHAKAGAGDFRGCAFMLAVAENEQSQPIRTVALEHKKAVKAIFGMLAEQLTQQPKPLTEQIALMYEGALATIAVTRNPNAALEAMRGAELLIQQHTSPYEILQPTVLGI